jgi:hypothetical protein
MVRVISTILLNSMLIKEETNELFREGDLQFVWFLTIRNNDFYNAFALPT